MLSEGDRVSLQPNLNRLGDFQGSFMYSVQLRYTYMDLDVLPGCGIHGVFGFIDVIAIVELVVRYNGLLCVVVQGKG